MINPSVWHSLGLNDWEYNKIKELLQREPTITELVMFSVEWSEHCGYPSSRKYIKKFPKEGLYPVLVGEDAGGIILDDLAIVFKMESHNHPSQVEPKQGAATGVGGIIRDVFTSGARPIALLDSLRFGSLDIPYNRYLLREVVNGIAFYGNCVGVPTVGGEVYFDNSYTGNCLVNVMCVGVCPKDRLMRAQAKGEGNSIIYAGASTGRDGIGGCSVLASNEFKENEEKRPTVQIGDPFTEKCLIEATLEAIKTGNIVGIKDMGAAGLTCSISEMAYAGNSGIEVDISLVPLREPDMTSWEIMMSESQERMLLCVKKGKEKEILDIFEKWDLQAKVIGRVTSDGLIKIKYKDEIVANIRSEHLASAPLYDREYIEPEYIKKLRESKVDIPLPEDFNDVLKRLVSSLNICSKEWIYTQYDHMVQVNTVGMGLSDASIIRLKDTDKFLALTTDCNSKYCYMDPYIGAKIAVCEAARNIACVGGRPAGITDCLNFGSPQKSDRFWQFKRSIEGIIEACEFLKIPVVSGNVSFYNESPQSVINPTPTIGMVGIIEDEEHICTANFKKEGDLIVLLGECTKELGGSEYLKVIHNQLGNFPPQIDLSKEKSLQKVVYSLIENKLVNSCHDCSEGGLAIAVLESCIMDKENLKGVILDIKEENLRPDEFLFGEATSRVIVSTPTFNLKKIENIVKREGIPMKVVGKIYGNRFIVVYNNRKIINLSLQEIFHSWHNSLEKAVSFI